MGLLKKDPNTPEWMRLLLALFVLYMFFIAYSGEKQEIPAEGEEALPSLDHYPAVKNFFNIDQWRREINPAFAVEIEAEDITPGTGDIAMCGQHVTVKISYVQSKEEQNENGIETYYHDKVIPTYDAPLEFIIGDNTTLPAWQQAVRGMKIGGIRQVRLGPGLLFPDVVIEDVDAPLIPYVLEMQKLEPHNDTALQFSVTTLVPGEESYRGLHVHASCGDAIAFEARLYNAAGQLLYDSAEQGDMLKTFVGKGEFGHGIDRGLFGMKPLEVRRVMIPPAYQNGDVLPFPNNEIAIVELVRIAYTSDEIDAHMESLDSAMNAIMEEESDFMGEYYE